MKIEVKEKEENKTEEFPCLMRYTDIDVVLLLSETNGFCYVGVVVADSANNYGVGTYSDEWEGDSLEPFNGSITLSND